MRESEFQATVVELATWLRWRMYHTHDSRRSHAGFPDLVLVRAPRVIFAELKSEKGIVRPEQRNWLGTLQACPGVETYLWRPSDMGTIEEVLT